MSIIVFTNGCFDILHDGHLSLLKECRSYGDRLIVGLNSDSSVKILKGEKRPIFGQEFRKRHLLDLRYVDEVIIFEEDTPLKLLRKITPHFFVKGGDYTNPVGFDFVRSYGGEVVIIPDLTGLSTSKIIEKVKNL